MEFHGGKRLKSGPTALEGSEQLESSVSASSRIKAAPLPGVAAAAAMICD